MEIYAPVIIPTLCRFEHFKRCVESLSRCTHADKTELIIGLDYPAKEAHVEGYKAIKAYLEKGIRGFKKVTVIEYSENQGVSINYKNCTDYAYSLYDSLIFSEDDNEFSPNFLDFINKGLSKYRDSEQIVAVCGYAYPVDIEDYPNSTYLSHNYSAWGCGFWKHKQKEYENKLTFEETKTILKKPSLLIKILRIKPTLLFSLYRMVKNNKKKGDTNRELYNIVYNHLCVFPRISLVRNWGHDGSGVNCYRMESQMFVNQQIDTATSFDLDDKIELLPKKYNKRLRKYFGDRPLDFFRRFSKGILKAMGLWKR